MYLSLSLSLPLMILSEASKHPFNNMVSFVQALRHLYVCDWILMDPAWDNNLGSGKECPAENHIFRSCLSATGMLDQQGNKEG